MLSRISKPESKSLFQKFVKQIYQRETKIPLYYQMGSNEDISDNLKHTIKRFPTFSSESIQGRIAKGFLNFTVLGGNSHKASERRKKLTQHKTNKCSAMNASSFFLFSFDGNFIRKWKGKL